MSKSGWPVGVVDVSDFSGGSPLSYTCISGDTRFDNTELQGNRVAREFCVWFVKTL